MTTQLQLRRFVYLDADLVNEFLSQLEGGLLDQLTDAQTANTDRKLGGKLGVPGTPLGVEASRGRSGTTSRTRVLSQTPQSAFQRLYNLLAEAGEIQPLDTFDDALWETLRRQQILEISAALELPDVFAVMAASESRGRMVEQLRVLGSDEDDFDDDEVREMMVIGEAMKHVFPQAALTGRAVAAPEYRFIVPLRNEALRVPITDNELLGEVTVLATLRRLIPRGAVWTLAELTNRSLVEDDESPFDHGDWEDSDVPGPAAVLNPVAMYL